MGLSAGPRGRYNEGYMSQTYIAAIVGLLTVVLPIFGVQIETSELTNGIQSVVVAITFVWILVRRFQAGGVTVFGARKVKYSKD